MVKEPFDPPRQVKTLWQRSFNYQTRPSRSRSRSTRLTQTPSLVYTLYILSLRGAIGSGKATEGLLAKTIQRVWVPGQVCLFDLIEEARPSFEHSQEEDDDDDDSEADVKSKVSTAFEVAALRSIDDNVPIMYAALIRTHHITSRKKVATLKAAAKQIGCAALLRSGGTPGVMYVESKHMENVKKWVDTVHDLRYKDYQLVSPPGVVPGRPPVTSAGESFDFEEVGSVKDFGAKMEEKGITDWWRKAMGYVSD
jgi:hypothetical protein